MNDKNRQNTATEKEAEKQTKRVAARSAKECAYLSAFVALLIVAQLVFSFLPGVEIVTVSFVTYSLTMGARRGTVAATAFSLLRQLVFGFFPTVLVLYLIYFNLLALCFGGIGLKWKAGVKTLPWLVVIACACTVCFTLIDNVLTPLWYGYSAKATRAYFFASLPFMIPQVICTAVSVIVLLFPLSRVFSYVKKQLF
ncbi:MAG: hypothetical protein J6B56_05915 [Clostridia bacterium]|nr:hypothetical protein [Clostridia bacterium]